MNIFISTNLYAPSESENIFILLDKINDKNIGIELFTEWHDRQFIEILSKNLDKFKSYPSSLHGPYYHTEHSKRKGCIEYETSTEYFRSTLELSKQLKSKYIVYHHNNGRVKPESRLEMISNSAENLLELNELANEYGIDIVVENAGVLSRHNVLFNEEQFIEIAKGIENKILLDIGHAFANNWNLNYVINELKDKIVAYHLHNNDGVEDNHNRIRDGKLSIDDFFESYRKFTPSADLVFEYSKHCNKDVEGIIEDVNDVKKILGIR